MRCRRYKPIGTGNDVGANQRGSLVVRLAGVNRDPAGLEIFDDTFRKLPGDAVEERGEGCESTFFSRGAAARRSPKKKKALTGQHRLPVRACLRVSEAEGMWTSTIYAKRETKDAESAVAPRGKRIPHRCAAISPVAAFKAVSERGQTSVVLKRNSHVRPSSLLVGSWR